MSLSRTLLVGAVMSSMLLGGCTSMTPSQSQYSGYLVSYADLQKVSLSRDQKALRWVSPSWNPDSYDVVAFEQLDLFISTEPNDRVTAQTLNQLQASMTATTRHALSEKYRVIPNVASAPANTRVLLLRVAITGVQASNEGMKWYEVVPVAAVVGGVSAAIGHRDQDSELYLEAEMVDARTKQSVAKVVRKVFGEPLENARQPVTAETFKVAMQGLDNDLQAFLQ
jgi:hypothetical protein